MPRNKADDSGSDRYASTSLGPLFDEPRARRTDPKTSHAAAKSVRGVRKSQAEVLRVLTEHGPLTDAGIYRHLDSKRFSLSGARTRRSELVAQGLAFDTGQTERLDSGRRAILWGV